MGLCQMLTKGHCMHKGRPKNSSSCVSVEYSSQATSTNPHFFGFHPLPCWFLGGSGRFIYFCYDIILTGRELWFDFHYVIIIKPVGKSLQWKSWKTALDGAGRLHPPLTINGAKPFCYLIFPLLAKPTTRGNENNSHLILFHILLVRNILQQRGRFIWIS